MNQEKVVQWAPSPSNSPALQGAPDLRQGSMSDFDYDIFISYAHADNSPEGDPEEWIAQLHLGIENWAIKLTGKKPSIWRDRRLEGIDYFDERIDENLEKAALLVAVMSPPYVASEWCQRELNHFLETARKQGHPRIADKARVVKVIKNPIPREAHPPELQNVLGYQFYQVIDTVSGKTRELNKLFGPEDERQYNAQLYDLVYEISDALKLIHEQRNGTPTPAPLSPAGKTVYLAVTTDDLNPQRDDIRRELEQHGHTVLPEGNLSWSSQELESQVRACLERCTLSIHPVGEHFSFVPEAAGRSVIELQNALAVERSQDASFEQVIWFPEGLEPTDEHQRAVVQAMRDDPGGAELLETTLEDLKTFIQDRLRPQTPRPPYLYLLCNHADLDDIAPLYTWLEEQGFDVKLPVFEDDEDAVDAHHQKMLNLCDTILIYYGHTNNAWVDAKLVDLPQGPGAANKAMAVYVTDPQDPMKALFSTSDVDAVIKDFGDFSPDALAGFLDVVRSKRGGPGG